MSAKHIIGGCTWVLLVSAASVMAADSNLADAVMAGDKAAVRTLLDQHTDVNAPQADGATALHWAVYRRDTALAELLIRAGAKVTVGNREGATPLSLATLNGDAAMIEMLLKAGADANEQLANGETALMMASRTGNPEAMKVLLDHGANVNAKERLHGTTALMWAADQQHTAAVKLLIDHGADVSASSAPDVDRDGARGNVGNNNRRTADPRVDRREQAENAARGQGRVRLESSTNRNQTLEGGGLTALVYAVRRGDLETVKVLLTAGADINQLTGSRWSPLLVATHNRHYQIGSFLMDRGADTTIANKAGWTPLYLAVDNRNIEDGDYPVRKPDMDHLVYIKELLSHGADATVNARVNSNTERRTVFRAQWVNEDGETAFMRAAESSDIVLLRLLLSYGADPSIPTRDNVTPLQVAAGIGWVDGLSHEWSEQANIETLKLLLALGGDPNAQADTGRAALHGAAHKGRTSAIQILVDAGARLDIRDHGNSGHWVGGRTVEHEWEPVDYADGLIRIGTQSPVAQPEAAALLRKLMTEAGLYVPPMNRTLETVCVTARCE
jgi:ankyrin repeat protein